jgi:hypothetical protein
LTEAAQLRRLLRLVSTLSGDGLESRTLRCASEQLVAVVLAQQIVVLPCLQAEQFLLPTRGLRGRQRRFGSLLHGTQCLACVSTQVVQVLGVGWTFRRRCGCQQ